MSRHGSFDTTAHERHQGRLRVDASLSGAPRHRKGKGWQLSKLTPIDGREASEMGETIQSATAAMCSHYIPATDEQRPANRLIGRILRRPKGR
jgi:hypothetical protein